mgnify:CR=1 FL=1
MSRSARVLLTTASLLGAFGLQPARAMYLGPNNWPVDRMIENVGRYIERHPEAAEAHYTLGRIHAYAFALQTEQLAVTVRGTGERLSEQLESGEIPLAELTSLINGIDWQEHRGGPVAPSALLDHLDAAIRSLRRALELQPSNAVFHLTFAYALEHGAHLASALDNWRLFGAGPFPHELAPDEALAAQIDALGSPESAERARAELSEPKRLAAAFFFLDCERASPDPQRQRIVARLLERWWLDQALDQYRKAFEQGMADEPPMGSIPAFPGPVSLEAGDGYLRLTASDASRIPVPDGFRERVAARVKELDGYRRVNTVSPILLALDGCHTLDELLLPGHRVLFDVDGDLVEEPWPWIAPSTGWLVWDPDREGSITSGRQLFGTGSGWFFFPDGYRVLDALDDDRNSELRGAELTGIAVWFDRDSDGVSDRGEVVPVEALGIVALATEATERVGRSLGNACGLELADGRVLPTYDWVLEAQQP